jgi:hypothetical protein
LLAKSVFEAQERHIGLVFLAIFDKIPIPHDHLFSFQPPSVFPLLSKLSSAPFYETTLGE